MPTAGSLPDHERAVERHDGPRRGPRRSQSSVSPTGGYGLRAAGGHLGQLNQGGAELGELLVGLRDALCETGDLVDLTGLPAAEPGRTASSSRCSRSRCASIPSAQA